MKYTQRESEIEKKVKAYAVKKGYLVRKFTSPGRVAVPDDIFMKDEVVFFIEFKAPGKKPTKAQLVEHEKIRACGIDVHVVDNIGDGMGIIDLKTEFEGNNNNIGELC